MGKYIIFLLFFFFFFQKMAAQDHSDTLNITKKKFFNVSIFPVWSTNGEDSEVYENNISLSLIYNRVRTINGFSLAPFNHIEQSMNGLQIGGFNYVDPETGSMRGLQIGISNSGGKRASGLQVGFMNGSVFMNGVQIGFINAMDEGPQGLQLGFCNYKKKGSLQIGVINIADHNDYPIGLVNVIKDGDINAGLVTDEIHSMIASVRSGGKYLYGVAGIGYNVGSSNGLWVLEGGMGVHIHISDRFKIDTEFTATEFTKLYSYVKFGDKYDEREEIAKNYNYKTAQKLTFKLLPNIRIGEKIKIMGGPTLNYLYTHEKTNRLLFPSNYLWRDFNSSTLKQLHLGWTFGVCYYIKI